ncbi:MAG: sugar transferase [Deltaproteobacteria bacterium]|nr:sugar transferase [Deltaproteobacteria bacterium]
MMRSMALLAKRVFDIVVSLAALVVLLPVIGLIALAIKLDDGGPLLFIQERVGRGLRKFRCIKFRTMIVGAESQGNRFIVTKNDARVTRVGDRLRSWTLDEIPQLINVLKGEMSIVGPRPWVEDQARHCAAKDRRRFDFKPGMAGWAWIHGRNKLPWDERVRLDLWYVDHWSFRLDVAILVKAVLMLLRRDGVHFADSAATLERGAAITRRAKS